MRDSRPTAATRQRTLNFRLRLYLVGTFNVVSRYGWLPWLPCPRRNQYKPWFLETVSSKYASANKICSEVNLLPSHLLYILYADIQAHVKASPHIIYSICHFTLLLSSPLPAFRSLQVRSQCIVDDHYNDCRKDCIYKGSSCAPFCKNLCHLLRLSQNVLFVKVSDDRICNDIKMQVRLQMPAGSIWKCISYRYFHWSLRYYALQVLWSVRCRASG